MKKFILKILLFFALITIIDIASGFVFKNVISRAKYGDTFKHSYIANTCTDDVIILGSSKAARHYVPDVLQDSLSLSCYNCGEPGCGIIPAYAYYKMIAKRKKPLLVIYEVTPYYDYYVTDEYSKYLGRIRQYYDKKPVKEMYKVFGDELETYRLISHMYQNNSSIVHNLMDIYIPTLDYRGYGPLFGKLPSDAETQKKETSQTEKDKALIIDSLKLSYVEKLLADMRNDEVHVICMASPQFEAPSEESIDFYNPIIKICKKYDIPFIDNRNYAGITGDIELFQDFTHLNDIGARKYTALIVPHIRNLFNAKY